MTAKALHTSKSTPEWLKKQRFKVLQWPGQNPYILNLDVQCHDLKKACINHGLQTEATLLMKSGPKFPPQQCERLKVKQNDFILLLLKVVTATEATESWSVLSQKEYFLFTMPVSKTIYSHQGVFYCLQVNVLCIKIT